MATNSIADQLADSTLDKTTPETIGQATGLPKGLLDKVVRVESGGNPNAVSPKGARGLGQNMPATARNPGFGQAPYDPQSLAGSARYLKAMIDDSGGDVNKGLAKYNAGPYGDPNNRETRNYVQKVGYQPQSIADQLADDVLANRLADAAPPAPPQQSPMATSQQGIGQPVQMQNGFPKIAGPQNISQALTQPIDRTQQYMKEDVNRLWQDVKGMATKPTVKGAFNTALDAIGIPFSPLTSAVQAFAADPINMATGNKAKRYVDMAAQIAVPSIGAKSKMLREALGATGRFLFGIADDPGLQAGKAFNATPHESAGILAQKFQNMDQAKTKLDLQWDQWSKDFIENHPDYLKQGIDEKLYHAGEGVKVTLTKADQYYAKMFSGIRKRNDRLAQEAKGLGVTFPKDYDPRTWMHREAIIPETKGFMESLGETMDPSGTFNPRNPRGLGTHPSVLQDVAAGGAKNPVTGEDASYLRIYEGPDAGKARIMQNGKTIAIGTLDKKGTTLTTKAGDTWDLGRGTTQAIEKDTGVQYRKSAMYSLVQTNRQLNEVVMHAKFMKALTQTPEFAKYAVKTKANTRIPEGWKQAKVEGYAGLDDYYFHPELAEVVRDWTRTAGGEPLVALEGLTRAMQSSIFLIPTKHPMNVLLHNMVQAGLFGGTVRLINGAVRAVTPGEQTMTRRAVEAVVNKNADYMRYLQHATSLRGANVQVQNFSNNLLKRLGQDPNAMKTLNPIAKMIGYATGREYLQAVYSASNKIMWGASDIMMMKAFLTAEEHYGGSERQIAQMVEHHAPNYQIPSRVAVNNQLGRTISRVLQAPLVFSFSRYEYGRLASMAHMVHDVVKPTVGSRAQSLDQIAALVFHTTVTYSMLDYAIQKATGNPNASAENVGPMTITRNVMPRVKGGHVQGGAYQRGEKTKGDVISSAFSPAQAVSTLKEAATNKQWSGKEVWSKKEFPRWLASKTYPTDALYKIVNPRKGLTRKDEIREFLEDIVMIKDPTPEQYAITEKYARQELAKRKKQ